MKTEEKNLKNRLTMSSMLTMCSTISLLGRRPFLPRFSWSLFFSFGKQPTTRGFIQPPGLNDRVIVFWSTQTPSISNILWLLMAEEYHQEKWKKTWEKSIDSIYKIVYVWIMYNISHKNSYAFCTYQKVNLGSSPTNVW